MTPEQFDELFDVFTVSAFRLEVQPHYDVGGRDLERFEAYRDGRELPERDPAWLARIAATTAQGKTWTRIRIVDTPLTPYEQFELDVSYPASALAGDRTLVLWRSPAADVLRDFWLFDAGTPGAYAVYLDYDRDGHWQGARMAKGTTELAALAKLLLIRAVPFRHALPLRHA